MCGERSQETTQLTRRDAHQFVYRSSCCSIARKLRLRTPSEAEKDVVRHALVSRIVKAYNDADKKKSARKKSSGP